MSAPRLTPWQRIARAVERGTGVRLSAEDVESLGMDHAIMTRAELDDIPDDEDHPDRDPTFDHDRIAPKP